MSGFLRERLVTADARLRAMAESTVAATEHARLLGKAEGVRLAISYIDEAPAPGRSPACPTCESKDPGVTMPSYWDRVGRCDDTFHDTAASGRPAGDDA